MVRKDRNRYKKEQEDTKKYKEVQKRYKMAQKLKFSRKTQKYNLQMWLCPFLQWKFKWKVQSKSTFALKIEMRHFWLIFKHPWSQKDTTVLKPWGLKNIVSMLLCWDRSSNHFSAQKKSVMGLLGLTTKVIIF